MSLVTNRQKQKSVLNLWQIEENNFPHHGTASEKLKFLLNYTIVVNFQHP